MGYIYIYGASGHSKVIIEIAESLQKKIGGLTDDNPDIKSLLNYPVNEEFKYREADRWVLGIGDNRIRRQVALKGERKYTLLIHPKATISSRAGVNIGTIVMAGVTVNSGAKIGKHCIVNTNASVDHECIIEDYVHLSPNVALGGGVIVGEGTHVGIGVSVIQGVTIGKWCVVGAGAVVIRDIPDGSIAVGNPARIIKYRDIKSLFNDER